jgi:hypothetical protein
MVLMNLVVKLSREKNINPIPSMDVENVIKQLLPLSVWNFDFLIPQSHWGKASSNNKTLNARLLARVITGCHYT